MSFELDPSVVTSTFR